ncbi:MAG TPA: RNA polymerase sigma factor [Pirellulaceae bacterium]
MRQAADGDRQALRSLLEVYGPVIHERIQRDIAPIWRSSLDADDVMQVSYLEAFLNQQAMTAVTGASFQAWLGQIARNNLRDAIKELGREKRPHPARRVTTASPDDRSCLQLLDVLSDGGESPSRHVARDEASQVIQSLVERLPADYAQVIRLYDLEERSIDEVATTMSRSAGAVHMLRSRAHDRLRGWIQSETDFFSRGA